MQWLLNPESLTALVTLTAMEIVLGIDNIVFISIMVARLPAHQQEKARKLGISLALVFRLALLFVLSWLIGLTAPWVNVFGHDFSGRDLILLGGGLFLLTKATKEIHNKVEHVSEKANAVKTKNLGFYGVLFQVLLLDVVFSLDSVITAVGMAKEVGVMIIAMILAVIFMLFSAKMIGDFVEQNPTIKILALSFLLLIGVLLLVEGMGNHIEKGYVYFAMAFSLSVELLNMRYRKKAES